MPKNEIEKFVEHITDNNNTLLGIVVRAKFNKDGVNFIKEESVGSYAISVE